MPETVLFVDDQESVLKRIKKLFENEPYHLLFARSASEALSLMEKGDKPTVVVSDQKMEGMSGLELLERVKKQAPDTMRLMITGYDDIQVAIQAINKVGLYRYILKPWDNEDLKQAVRDAVRHFSYGLENRKLSFELAKKNKELEYFNSNLEKRFKESSRELRQAYEENLELTAKLEKKVRELKGRDRILQHLLTIHTLEETLEVILEVISGLVEADSAVIYLPQEGGKTLNPVVVRGLTDDELIKRPMCHQVALRVYDTFEEERNDLGDFGHFISVPIVREGVCRAVLEVSRQKNKPVLSDDDLRVIGHFKIHIAIAISDSQIHHDLPSWECTLDEVLRDLQ